MKLLTSTLLLLFKIAVFSQNSPVIQLTTKVNNAYHLIQQSDSEVYLLVNLVGAELKSANKRAPLNISLVLDRSGSMAGEKLANAKKAINFIIDQLSSDDFLSIVNYDDRIEATSPSEKIKNKEFLKEKVNTIHARGSTNLTGGLLEGFKQVASTQKDGFVNRVLLVSDGLANIGIIEPTKINDTVRQLFNKTGIAVSTFGVGADFNEDLMTSIAENGKGNYYFIDTSSKIPSIFERELDGLLKVVAQKSTIKIDYPVNLKLDKVFGYDYTNATNSTIINLNDIYSKEEREILVRFKIIEPIPDKITLKTEVNYKDAQTNIDEKLFSENNIFATKDTIKYQQNIDSLVDEMIVVYTATELLDDAMKDVDNGNYSLGRSKIDAAGFYMEKNAAKTKTGKIQKQQSTITKYKDGIKDIETKSSYDKKILQKSSKSINYEMKKSRK